MARRTARARIRTTNPSDLMQTLSCRVAGQPTGSGPLLEVRSPYSGELVGTVATVGRGRLLVGDDLPATINPLQFFVDNWWRNTLVAVYVDGRVPQADNWYLLSYLRDRIPPNLLLVLIVGLKGGEASMVIGDDASSLAETMKPIEEPITMPVVTATMRTAGATCE